MRDFDYTGKAAGAWRVGAPPLHPDHTAALASWVIEGATIRMRFLDIIGQAMHSRWLVAVIHLRPVDGQSRAAYKQYPKAEHELAIITLDPTQETIDPDDERTIIHMPSDFGLAPIPRTVQFDGVGDENAKLIGYDAVRVICDGDAHPDLPQHWWERSIVETVRHYREGKHGERRH